MSSSQPTPSSASAPVESAAAAAAAGASTGAPLSAQVQGEEQLLEEDEVMQEDELEYASSSQASSTQTSTQTWINWYTSLPGHDFYCEVHEEYIEDDFNLTGLQSQVPFWKEALEMVLDVEPEEDSLTIPDVSIIETSAELLFGLVHQRFILTKAGLTMMAEKYEQSAFGACPRVYCHSTAVLPCGRADAPGLDTVKLYCPNCGDLYGPASSKYASVDGAFFGTSFPTLFFQTYPEFLSMPFKASTVPLEGSTSSSLSSPSAAPGGGGLVLPPPATNPNRHGGQRPALAQTYVPRIYGFRVSERARSGPRMGWLRARPEGAQGLDEVDWKGRWVATAGGGGGADDDDDQAGGGARPKRSGLFDDDEDDRDDGEEQSEEEEEGQQQQQQQQGGGGEGGATTRTRSTATRFLPYASRRARFADMPHHEAETLSDSSDSDAEASHGRSLTLVRRRQGAPAAAMTRARPPQAVVDSDAASSNIQLVTTTLTDEDSSSSSCVATPAEDNDDARFDDKASSSGATTRKTMVVEHEEDLRVQLRHLASV